MSDYDDWLIKQVVCEYFYKEWGKYICDIFVFSQSNKYEVFNLKYYCVEISGIDVFKYVLLNRGNWVVLLFMLILKVVR